MRTSSAIAFPRILGIDLSSSNAPRLHSFAWNVGVRLEPRVENIDFTKYLSYSECQRLTGVYLATVHPVYDFIDQEAFTQRWQSRYVLREETDDIDAIVCGVVALGKRRLSLRYLPNVALYQATFQSHLMSAFFR